MFSSITMASSITIPTATVKPKSVMESMVKPIIFIKMNEPMMEMGIAKKAINVERSEPIKISTITPARKPPKIKCSSTVCTDALMLPDWSSIRLISISWGSVGLISSSFSFTPSITDSVFVPDCFLTSSVTARLPFKNVDSRSYSPESSA